MNEPTKSAAADAQHPYRPEPPPAEALRMPPQIKYIIGNEGCERFSFYGMRSILTVFMSGAVVASVAGSPGGLGFSEPDAKSLYHTFVAACYLFPLLGAFLADRWLGRYKVILYVSLFYCAGHAVLSIWENRTGLVVGLALIALGSGGIKPCVSAFVGDQFTEKNKSLVERVYNLFYWIINFGSFFSTLLIPYLRNNYGNSVAFGLPGILMAIATVVFFMGRKHYRILPPERKGAGAFAVIGYALTHASARKPGQSIIDGARGQYSDELVDGVAAALRIGRLFITVSVFWALFDQHGSSWVLQATRMNLDVNAFGMHLHLLPSQLASLNPLIVMGLIPLFTFVVYPLVGRMGFKLTPLRRMTVGMFTTGFAFVVVALIQFGIDGGQHMSVLWQVIPYLIITAAEVLISVTGLEFAYTQAPASMKSTIMSFWLLTVFAGNLLTAYVERVNPFGAAYGFLFYAGLMFVVALIFAWQAMRFKVIDHMVESAAK